jgi:hypothetical protein
VLVAVPTSCVEGHEDLTEEPPRTTSTLCIGVDWGKRARAEDSEREANGMRGCSSHSL